MSLSFLGSHGYRFCITTCVANMLNFSYPKRTGEQGVQGEQGNKGNRENSEKKGTEDAGKQGEQGNRGTRDQGEQGKNNICTHNLWRDKGQIGLRLSLGNKNNQVKELYSTLRLLNKYSLACRDSSAVIRTIPIALPVTCTPLSHFFPYTL